MLNEKADECTMERFSGGNVKDRHHLETLFERQHNIKLYLQELRQEHGLNISKF